MLSQEGHFLVIQGSGKGVVGLVLAGASPIQLSVGVHTNDFAPIHGRRARIHTAPAESTVDSTYCLPQALCEYGRADRESGRNR